MPTVRIIGPGRAGLSLARALERADWDVLPVLGRADDVSGAARGTDVLVIATPDSAVPAVAAAVTPVEGTPVVHLAGALGLEALAPHRRRASVHPLVSLPDARLGVARLVGAWFAVSGDPVGRAIVSDLHGRALLIDEASRVSYHAAACIASNHLVALLGQVERVAADAGAPLAAFLDLVRTTVENVAMLGPSAALTGPVARGDWDTVERHLDVLDPEERPAYRAMAELATRLMAEPEAAPWS